MKHLLVLLTILSILVMTACHQSTNNSQPSAQPSATEPTYYTITDSARENFGPYLDLDRTHKPSEEDILSITQGMHITEVVALLGKPHWLTGSPMPIFIWQSAEGQYYSLQCSYEDDAPKDLRPVERAIKHSVVITKVASTWPPKTDPSTPTEPPTPTEQPVLTEPANPTESPTVKPENNATEPSTDVPEAPINGSDDNQESGDVPVYLTFASLEEIDEFIAAANGTKDEYDSYYRKLEFGERINQSTAKTLAKNITDNLFPVTSDKLIIEEFGATYYVEYQELNLYYQIDGLRYRFTYKFNYTKDLTHRTEPIVLTAKLGPYTFDMYQSGNWVGGFAKDGTTLISFAVFTKQPELVNASYFDLASRKDAPAVD